MPELELVSEEEFNKSSTLYKETPFDDEFLSYSVRLPKNWSKQDSGVVGSVNLSNKILGELDRYYAPPRLGERSRFTMQAVELEYRLTAEQWLALFVLENSYTLEGMKVIDDSRVEVIYVLVDKGQTYIVTATAIVSGPRVIFAKYTAPSEVWEAESPVAYRVIESFELLNIDDSEIEPVTPYQFLDIAQMEYPTSWRLITKPLKSAEQMSVDLLNITSINSFSTAKILKGKMEVHLVADYAVEDIEKDIIAFKDGVVIERLTIRDQIEEIEDFVIDEAMDLLEVKVYEAASDEGSIVDYEFWMAVMYAQDYYYFITLLTPARDSDYLSWARNTQTLRVVSETIAPLVN